jgi:hypothetical protein
VAALLLPTAALGDLAVASPHRLGALDVGLVRTLRVCPDAGQGPCSTWVVREVVTRRRRNGCGSRGSTLPMQVNVALLRNPRNRDRSRGLQARSAGQVARMS